ncbi:aminotransferase class I/II-fold pyridoxal phosphate-dependent enzyme [Neobacillus sp. LXY-4]|uniref:aminotransferase class I/II-fold pyridoxal phosphate-dependent enzyme n=1 Tax=Neobacillus sp. LXY-4 TaxID=3379826 RepID=UPI003EDEF7DC
MKDYSKTPIFDRLVAHSNEKPISFHVPGHKNGGLFTEGGSSYYNQLLKLDVTELTGLDDLHSPHGIIQESEELLSNLYNVKKSFLLVNGTTVGNLAMIMASINEDDKVLVQRNCHKSILNGLQLANADPVFLSPEYDKEWKVAGGPSYETVEAAIKKYPNAKALILTYPNYYGIVYKLGKMIELAHSHNIPVLVDEAHGAHFIAGEPFPASAVTLGADVVVQSAHKTLPAMTMGSFLHFNSELISLEHLEKYLHILQSSSPSYPIMASLDIARSYLSSFDKEDLDYLQSQIIAFRRDLSEIPGIKVLGFERGIGDLLKITIQTASTISGFDLQEKLEDLGIYTELADPYNVLLIAPLLKKGMDYPFKEVVSRISKAAAIWDHTIVQTKHNSPYIKKGISKLNYSFKEMKVRKSKLVPIQEAIGQVAAEMIVPYPPGIPLLFPGEMICSDDVEQLKWLLTNRAKFQGGASLREGLIHVY